MVGVTAVRAEGVWSKGCALRDKSGGKKTGVQGKLDSDGRLRVYEKGLRIA